MTAQLKRLLILIFLLTNSTYASSNLDVKHQVQLAYLDLLVGKTSSAYQRIPKKTGTTHDLEKAPALLFAQLILNYGQNKLAISALENHVANIAESDVTNSYWLDFTESFLESGSVASAEQCLINVEQPIQKKDRSRYYRLTADIALEKLNIDQAEYMLSSKWKGRDSHKPYTRVNLATAYAFRGNFAAAHTAISQLPKDIPKKIDEEEKKALLDTALIRMGFAYLHSGDFNKAKVFLSKVPLQSIHAQRATLGLAWADISAERYTEALLPLMHLIENTENHQIEKQEAYSLLALVTSKQKKYGKAANLYLQSKEDYLTEIEALKRYSIPIYSGKIVGLLGSKEELQTQKNDLHYMQELFGKELHYYLHSLLEEKSTMVLINAYQQQNFMLQELAKLNRSIKISNDEYWRYQQALKKSMLKYKDRLIRLFSSEIESHISRLEEMAAHAEFSAGTMYEKAGN